MAEDNKKPSDIGDDIGNIVQKAISSVDYEQLGNMIGTTVDKALTEAKKGIKKGQYQMEKSIKAAKVAASNGAAIPKKQKALRAPVAKQPAGTIAGPMQMTGGILSVIMAGVFAVGGLFAGVTIPVIPIACLGFGGYLMGKSQFVMNRVKRFHTYVKTLDGRPYAEIGDLAEAIGKSRKYVAKDVNKMIGSKMFPEGTLLEDGGVLALSDEAAEAYEKTQEKQRQKEAAEAAQREREAENPVYKEARLVIEEGEATLKQIREANDAIPGEFVSRKLDRLETIIRKIFDFIRENPNQLMEMRRFMGYYLPTTLKLVNAYRDLEAQPVQGNNIVQAKTEIEGTLDTISGAFEKLLDSFYQDTAMDISTDISVMKTMFAQEGLVDDEMDINKQKK